MLQVVALDLDGVIADTFGIHVEGWQRIIEHFHLPTPPSFDHLRGAERTTAIRQLFSNDGRSPDEATLAEAIRIKNWVRDERIKEITPAALMPGIPAFLEACRADRIELWCISTNSATPKILDRLGIKTYFQGVIFGTGVTPPKNDSAECLSTWLEKAGFDRCDALYLDDSKLACTHAAAAGIPTVFMGTHDTPRGTYQSASLAGITPTALHARAAAVLSASHDQP